MAKKHNRESRREGALARMEGQLETLTKNTKEGVYPLSKKDKNRINKQINILGEPYKGYQKNNRKHSKVKQNNG